MTKTRQNLLRLCISALFLALALVLPFATGQIPTIGKMLCPMHIPVLLCGFICGPIYGGAVGAVAPILRSLLFTQPKIYPDASGMCVELMFYGVTAGLLYMILPKKKPFIYVSLVSAMIVGRIAWGTMRTLFYGIWGTAFGWQAFVAGGFANAFPGIVIQIIFIPLLIMTLEKEFPSLFKHKSIRLSKAKNEKNRKSKR